VQNPTLEEQLRQNLLRAYRLSYQKLFFRKVSTAGKTYKEDCKCTG